MASARATTFVCKHVNNDLFVVQLTESQRAVITEGLRISAISTSRLIRSAPYETLHYKGWDIPPNVIEIAAF